MSTLPGDVHDVNGPDPSVGTPTDSGSRTRETYRHGDLRNALIEAGVGLAAVGGPDAVVLREATRRAGVSPNAAYRHFADRRALLGAVSIRALGLVAEEIVAELARSARPERACEQLDAVGRAYVHFALREPGLFRTAFSVHVDPEPGRTVGGEPGPYGLLQEVLDHAVETGAMPAERRAGAEAVAWSAVHGLALLLLDGPLRAVPDADRDALIERVVVTVRAGLFA